MRSYRSSLTLAVAVVATLALLAALPAAAQNPIGSPTAVDLGLLAGYVNSEARAVNASGLIVGNGYDLDEDDYLTRQRACVWEPDTYGEYGDPTGLPLLGYTDSGTEDVDEAGQIVGWLADGVYGLRHACVWTKNGSGWDVTEILPDADWSDPFSMNASGLVVGVTGSLSGGLDSLFLWGGGTVQSLAVYEPADLGGESGTIDGWRGDEQLSDDGLVAGVMVNGSGVQGAGVWDAWSGEPRFFVSGEDTRLSAISPSGRWFAGGVRQSDPGLVIGTWDADGAGTLANLGHPLTGEPGWTLVWLETTIDGVADNGMVLGAQVATWDTDGDTDPDYEGPWMSWVWSPCDGFTELSSLVPGYVTGYIGAYEMNAHGWVPITVTPDGFETASAYVWRGTGTAVELAGLEGSSFAAVMGLNDGGLLVGESQTAEDPPVSHAVVWSVDPPAANQAPVLDVSTAPATGTIGTPVTFTATADDPDCDMLVFSLGEDAPEGASIDWRTGAFSWTPAATGTITFDVTVTDPYGEADTETVSVTVPGEPTPSALTVGDATVTRNGKSITVRVPITNTGTETAYDVTATAATLDGGTLSSRLPSIKNIRPGATKTLTVKFSAGDTATGQQTFTIEGTSSVGDFSTTQEVTVP